MGDCQKVCFDEEIVEEGRFQEVAQGKGDYVYQAQHVGMNQGNLVRYEPKKAYRCTTCCQVFCCLAVLALFVALLLWLANSPVFGFRGEADIDQNGMEVAFDCDEGFDAWKTTWNLPKKRFCCEHKGRGCEAAAFDCSGEPSSWDVDHRATCCDKGVKEACGVAAHPYNCQAGVENWKHGWSFKKKEWCCDRFKVSCDHVPEHHPVPAKRPVEVVHVVEHVPSHHAPLHYVPGPVHYQTHMHQPYDCSMGVDQWTTTWSSHKKAYCCTKSSVFCGGAGYGHVSHVYSSGPHYNSGTYYTEGDWSYGGSPHVIHADTYRGHAAYGYYTGGHSHHYSTYTTGGHSHHYSSYTTGGHSHHSSSYAGSYDAQIPTCGEAVSQQCPSAWKGGAGGFHCLHQLARQTSHTAYLKSGGACRPASQGPFPFNDCQDQCRIGAAGLSK